MRQRTIQRERTGKWLVTWRPAVCAAVVAAAAIQWLTAAGGAAAAADRPGSSPGGGRAAADSSGTALSWGKNDHGDLGNGTFASSAVPVRVKLPAGTKVTSLRGGCEHSLALTTTGKVLAWGENTFGQLGTGSIGPDSRTPVRVKLPAGTKVKAIRAGCTHSLALTTTGKVLAWGENAEGELGNGSAGANSPTPVRVKLPAGVKVTAISAGGTHSLAATSTGKVLAWGENSFGELGNGTTVNSDIPVQVKLPAGTKVTAVTAGFFHSLALTTKGRALAWGDNSDGELGNGTTTSITIPVRPKLPAGTRVRGLFAGCEHTLALTTAGRVLAWGSNARGQLGNGTTKSSSVPVRAKLPTGTAVTAISAGCEHSLALTSKGRVLAWGDNLRSELGNGGTFNSSTPVRVRLPAGLAATAVGSGPGAYFGLAIVHTRK